MSFLKDLAMSCRVYPDRSLAHLIMAGLIPFMYSAMRIISDIGIEFVRWSCG